MVLLSALLLILMFQSHWCLTGVHLRVPSAVKTTESITMSCSFTLQQERLYSVKFYLGDTEFYRYVPRETPPTRVFPVGGVSITLQAYSMNSSTVVLSHVHRDMTGYYKCEVSGDAPLFHTVIKSSFVIVTEEPESPPLVTADKLTYRVGDSITLTCISRGGYPLANLTWLLDNEHVSRDVSHYVLDGEVESSVVKFPLHVSSLLSGRGSLHLTCVANQFTLYHAATSLVLVEDFPPSSVLNDTVTFSKGSRRSSVISELLISVVLTTRSMLMATSS